MTCGACGTENESGRKFCGECGAALSLGCPSCGAPNPPSVKFCGECGVRLDVGAAPAPLAAVAVDFAKAETIFRDLDMPFRLAAAQLEHAEWLANLGRGGDAEARMDDHGRDGQLTSCTSAPRRWYVGSARRSSVTSVAPDAAAVIAISPS